MERGIGLVRVKGIRVVVTVCFILALFFPSTLSAKKKSENDKTQNSEEYLSKPLQSSSESDGLSDDLNVNTQRSATSSSGIGWFFGKVLLGLIVIAGGIWITAKFLQSSGMVGSQKEWLAVQSSLPLGQNQQLQIVQVGSTYLMLGVTKNNINLLGELTDSETIRKLKLDESDDAESNQQGGFDFGELVQKFTSDSEDNFSPNTEEDYLDTLRQKVSQLDQEGGQ